MRALFPANTSSSSTFTRRCPAFVLSKSVAITATFLTRSLVIPAIGMVIVCQLIWHVTPVATHFPEAIGIQALHQTFYISLTLILPNLIPQWIVVAMPWSLASAAASIAVWQPIPAPLWIPALATAGWTVLGLVVALWRFGWEEF